MNQNVMTTQKSVAVLVSDVIAQIIGIIISPMRWAKHYRNLPLFVLFTSLPGR
ncbi:hypothetical protein IT418_03925 [bacterium]|nr:hypothetical protein [bacterium]